MLGFQGPAQPSPALGDAINARFGYLEVKCLGCNTHQTVALDIVRRPKATPVYELERYMRCKDCSEVRGYAKSGAIWSRCGQGRFQPVIRPRRGGRASGEPGSESQSNWVRSSLARRVGDQSRRQTARHLIHSVLQRRL